MFDILAITCPIYLVIIVGYVTTRVGWFAQTDMRVLGNFVVKLALPSLVFSALSQRRIEEIVNLRYLACYLAGSLAVAWLGYAWSRRVGRKDTLTSTVYAMGMCSSNSGFIGFPILLMLVAPVAGVALALNMIVENVVVIPLMLTLAERARNPIDTKRWTSQLRKTLARLFANPLIIGLLAGLLVSLLDLRLPDWAIRTLSMFATTSGGLSLFAIGSTLAGLPLRGMGVRVMPIVVGKLLGHPALVLGFILLLPLLGLPALDPALRTAAVMMAAVPMMSIYSVLAQAYGLQSFTSAALLFTTVASFFTLSGAMLVLKHLPT